MYRTESDKTCDQTGFGWFVMYRMYRMLQACLELVDGKGGLLSLVDDSQRFETKEANRKFLSSFKQSFAPPGGSGGGGKRCVGAGSDGYSHGCVSLPSLGWNAKRMIQRHVFLWLSVPFGRANAALLIEATQRLPHYSFVRSRPFCSVPAEEGGSSWVLAFR